MRARAELDELDWKLLRYIQKMLARLQQVAVRARMANPGRFHGASVALLQVSTSTPAALSHHAHEAASTAIGSSSSQKAFTGTGAIGVDITRPRLGLSLKANNLSLQLLSRLLADEFLLYIKLRNAHWGVQSPQVDTIMAASGW